MALIDQGVNVIVEGLSGVGVGPIEVSLIDVSTDRLVIWTRGIEVPDYRGQKPLADDVPLEIYMEGNIVFREGERTVYANRMYYDVNNRIGHRSRRRAAHAGARLRGDLADQERSSSADRARPVPGPKLIHHVQPNGTARLSDSNGRTSTWKTPAAALRSVQRHASLRSDDRRAVHGARAAGHERNNFLYLGELPVFYWPFLATDLEEPSFFIVVPAEERQRVFGDASADRTGTRYQLFGIRNRPEGTDWDISFDYLSDRGFGHGTTFNYARDDFLSIPGPASGLADFWGIQDHGVDNLGRGRRAVPPEKDYRCRLFWQHRQHLPGDLQLSAELGWISDRNFLEQYYEREWDELKDQTTGVELNSSLDNSSWSITADYRLNDFFTQTDWLPRAITSGWASRCLATG